MVLYVGPVAEISAHLAQDKNMRPHILILLQRFDNWDKALMHAERQDHEPSETLYTCPLKDCSISVTGRALPKAGLKRNWHNHVDRGHISDIVELVYKPAEQLQFRPLPSYRTIFEHSTKGHSEHDGSPGVTPPSEEPLVGSEDSIGNEDDFESSEDIILQFEEEEEDVDRTEENRVELFSPEHRSQILAQNEEYWSM
ncbi:hypothetical protein NW762_011900 [Fusarium torreyae]|uniref:Uncharacterized protein n=1 Tax=Fusarium torreyae TaxID=1237075 RepID=A0A9W8RQJ5_9HYPO|nr:hypothetical protein NW762_011900 [Fusarium torreyae]